MDDYRDFSRESRWAHPIAVTFDGITISGDRVTPIACCRFTSYMVPVARTCASQPTDVSSNWNTVSVMCVCLSVRVCLYYDLICIESANTIAGASVCVYVCICVCACPFARACACACVRLYAGFFFSRISYEFLKIKISDGRS